MFRGTHRSSSGAQKPQLQPLVLHTSVVAGRGRQPQTFVLRSTQNLSILCGLKVKICEYYIRGGNTC